MDDLCFQYWLAGLCDGEAHFTFSVKASTTGRLAASPRFALTLREDDEPVLRFARDRLGVGRIYRLSKARERAAGKRSRDAVEWSITGPRCAVLANALMGKMQSKKAREVAIWAPAVLESVAMPRFDARRAPLLLAARAEIIAIRNQEEKP